MCPYTAPTWPGGPLPTEPTWEWKPLEVEVAYPSHTSSWNDTLQQACRVVAQQQQQENVLSDESSNGPWQPGRSAARCRLSAKIFCSGALTASSRVQWPLRT